MRDTKEIETLSGKKVIINAYLTGPENSELTRIILQNVAVTPSDEGETVERPKVPLSGSIDRTPKLLEMAIVAFDGKTEKKEIMDAVNSIPSQEYDDIVKQINTIYKAIFQPAK